MKRSRLIPLLLIVAIFSLGISRCPDLGIPTFGIPTLECDEDLHISLRPGDEVELTNPCADHLWQDFPQIDGFQLRDAPAGLKLFTLRPDEGGTQRVLAVSTTAPLVTDFPVPFTYGRGNQIGEGIFFVTIESPPPSSDADVEVTVAGPARVGQSTPLTYTITVANNGPGPATNVVLEDETLFFDTEDDDNSVLISQGSCTHSLLVAAFVVHCDLGTLDSGRSATVTLPGFGFFRIGTTMTNTATVSANEHDPHRLNNTAQASTIVSEAADLAVTVTDDPDPVRLNNPLFYTITITNNGDTATGVTLVDAITNALEIAGAVSSRGSCTHGPTLSGDLVIVDCNLGTLAGGETAIVTVEGFPFSTGTITNFAEVSANQFDPNRDNSFARQETTVIP
jgi:uncharacterized repeat protein (TIGR01451 family)